MGVWLTEMHETHVHHEKTDTYYVFGSGLIPVPHERVNDISELKSEFHAQESRRGVLLAYAIRVA